MSIFLIKQVVLCPQLPKKCPQSPEKCPQSPEKLRQCDLLTQSVYIFK